MYEALGVHAIAGFVKAAGHECDLLVASDEEHFDQKIADLKPDLIAFSCMTRQQEWVISTTNRLRERLDIPILLGGTHPTMYPETLGHCAADYLCVGEGEFPVLDLLNRMAEGGRTDNIPNIHAKVGGKLIKNEIRPLMTDWDDLAFPDREVYGRYPFLQELPLKRFITAFGCAYKCSFCYINNYREVYAGKGKFFRRKSVSRVINEMKRVRERYPLKRIHYVDDLFSLNKEWLNEFLPVYTQEIGLPWSANVWIAHMNEDMVRLFKENGCVGVTFGVESGDEKTRIELIDKHLPNDIFIKNCKYLTDYGIPFHTGNIIGLPGEGVEKAYETARFNRQIGATSTRAGLFWPFPGTKLTEYAVDHGMLSADYSVEYFNKGIYPKVKHEQVDELTVLANIFQLVAKWGWFERVSRVLLKWPKSFIVQTIAKLVDQSYWYHEAKFFGVLNWSGIKYYWHIHRSLAGMRRFGTNPEYHKDGSASERIENDAQGQRPSWNISKEDMDRVYEKTRDGIT